MSPRPASDAPAVVPAVDPRPKPPVTDKAADQFDPVYVFRIRRFKTGNFHNLWLSEMLSPEAVHDAEVVKVLDDANALNFVMDNIQGQIETDGF